MGLLVLMSIELAAVLWLAVGSALGAGQEESAEVERLFLADGAGVGEFRAVASFPRLLDRRPVQMKVFRSLASKDPEIFRAAVGLCLEAPRLESFAMIRRRLSLAFRSRDSWKRRAILQLARGEPERMQDLRFVSLLSEALRDPDPPLAEMALSLVRDQPGLRDLPAIAESLTRLPGEGRAAKLTLPSFRFFQERVLPLLERSGGRRQDLLRLPQVSRHISPGAGSGAGRTGRCSGLLSFGVAGHRPEAAGTEPPVVEADPGEASQGDPGVRFGPAWRRCSVEPGVRVLSHGPGVGPNGKRLNRAG